MPTTVNGIGTHYYGKKNVSVRTSTCGSCRRVGNLESYDTRLWFVILFIPVLPLGRKRIIDKCPYCTRHMAADADTYEQARQLQTSGSIERYRREPSPEAALEAHANLLAFHEHDQAREFRGTVLERFPDHAGLRAGLAAQLLQVSAYDDSAALYESALELDPDMPEARVGVARRWMALGKLDEARGLLDFLEAPGAGEHYSLGPLDQLSTYYQRQGRHEEALGIAEHLLHEIPQAGHQHTFRSFVRKSEKALGRPETILPPLEHSLRGLFRAEGSPYPAWQRWLAAGGVGLALLGAGLFTNNEYIRRHRTLHVVNACGPPVQVRVDDGPPVTVADSGRVVVSEGTHRVRVSGPVEETHEIDIRSGFFDRWFGHPVWVLNPGGEAVLAQSTVYYAANPRPSEQRLIVGKPFVGLADVDYPFEPPPDRMQVSSRDAEVMKTAVSWVRGHDANAFLAAANTDRESALAFAEHRLRRNPEQDELLRYYLEKTYFDGASRAEAFLKAGLERRPVAVGWHRAYQAMAEHNGHEGEVVPLYDRFLASEPADGALLYLRGRVDPDWDRQEEYYRRSSEAEPKLPWPWMARGGRAACAARWDDALQLLRKAQQLKIPDENLGSLSHVVRLAAGDSDGLMRDYRARLTGNPLDFRTMILLCDALAASGHQDKVVPEVTAWVNRLPPEAQTQLNAPMLATGLYVSGKAEECQRLCLDNPAIRPSVLHVQALLALGRVKEAADDGSFAKVWEDPWSTLSVSLGFALDGRTDDAALWRERACQKLETMSKDTRRAAKVLRADKPVPLDELERIYLDAEDRALLLAVLAERFPAKRAEYRAAATLFNIQRIFPSLLVRRAIETKAAGSP
jgi:tetratricopeptide (TPR) repeat protein